MIQSSEPTKMFEERNCVTTAFVSRPEIAVWSNYYEDEFCSLAGGYTGTFIMDRSWGKRSKSKWDCKDYFVIEARDDDTNERVLLKNLPRKGFTTIKQKASRR